jgi:glutamate--cysteine ligase
MGDFADHLTTLFPEVRLKRFLEMRGADSGPWDRLCALPALWVGLLYDAAAQDAAWDIVKDWTEAEREALWRDVPRYGLKTPFRRRPLKELALEVLKLAREGLRRRARLDRQERDEGHFLETLDRIAASGVTPAEEKLSLYDGRWERSVDPLFREFAY